MKTENMKMAQYLWGDFTTEKLVELHNSFCVESNNPDDEIYPMDDFDEILQGKTPWEVAKMCFFGNFAPGHRYFWFDGYGNIETGSFARFQEWSDDEPFFTDLPIFPEDIVRNYKDWGYLKED